MHVLSVRVWPCSNKSDIFIQHGVGHFFSVSFYWALAGAGDSFMNYNSLLSAIAALQ